MKIYPLIPARAGSKRIPNKNFKEFVNGYNLVDIAIKQARDIFREVFVSTDHLFDSAYMGAKIIKRPSSLAQDDTTMQDVIVHAAMRIGISNLDSVMILQTTSPLRSLHDILKVIAIHKSLGHPVYSVPEGEQEPNGAIYIAPLYMWCGDGWDDGTWYQNWRMADRYEMPEERSIDIDHPKDFRKAKKLWAKQRSV